jgi:hypothetical protein
MHHRKEQPGKRQGYASLNARMDDSDHLTQSSKSSGREQEPEGSCVPEHIGLQKTSERKQQ